MSYKLIATDMDGTLLNSKNKISKGNKQSIINIQKQNIKFVLASGRPSYSMYKYAKKLHMHNLGGYIISFNGGELIDVAKNEVIFSQGLEKEDMEIIYENSKKLNLAMVLYNEDLVYSSKDNANVRIETNLNGLSLKTFSSLEELFNLGIDKTVKCMMIGDPEDVKSAESFMKEKYGNEYFIATSLPMFLEIANKNVSKGKTLERLGNLLNIKTSEMIGIGDGGNDKALLETVGMPSAVENAIDEIKNIAKFISTNHNEDAIKNLIHNFFPKK